jgi:GNAT superfamily N-acetyltransferase
MPFLTPSPTSPLFAEILALGKLGRDTLGFLPNSAFEDRARQGTLLAYVSDEGELGGYAMYDLPRDEIRLGQLTVADNHRNKGIARSLVDQIQQRHGSRRGIFLHCRNDFPASKMWSKLDFDPRREKPGRSFDGKPLTYWWRSFGHPDLFTLLAAEDSRPLAVLDACVFFDLVSESPNLVSQALRSDWIVEHARLAVSAHLLQEIHKNPDPRERARERQAAQPLELPSGSDLGWDEFREKLKVRHPDAPASDDDDLIHLSRALAAGADWMVTADNKFARRYRESASALGGVRLVSPAEVVKAIDEIAQSDRYRPTDLAGTTATRREVDEKSLAALAEHFVNHPDGERIRDLKATIDEAAALTSHVRLQLVEIDGEPRGLLGLEHRGDSLVVPLVRVSNGVGAPTISRHLLAVLRDEAIGLGARRVDVLDEMASRPVIQSYAEEGFFLVDRRAQAFPSTGMGGLADLGAKLEAAQAPFAQALTTNTAPSEHEAAAAELAYSPYHVLGAGIPTFVVSIKPTWATALFSSELAERQLFPREWTLGLRRQLVYFRSPHAGRGIRAPARILWYVSGKDSPGGLEVRAVSLLREVLVGEAEHLFHRFERLAVYTRQQVESCADDGQAMALVFSHTREFATPVSLDSLRRIITGDPKSRTVSLVSPTLIDEHMFADVMRQGFPDEY